MFLSKGDVERQALIAELQHLGVKHTSDRIICIGRMASGKIVFLEEGRKGQGGCGLAHILERHKVDFERRGISPSQIPALIIAALTKGEFLGYQSVREPRKEIYEILFEDEIQYIAISVSDNGYIVGANPSAHP
jgi:hypothetical protein